MRTLNMRLIVLVVLAALGGCSSTNEPKKAKVEPTRTVEALFKGSSLALAKNKIMGACSSANLTIKTEPLVVTCETRKLAGSRERELTLVVNDEFASDIREVFEFTLTAQGTNVQVKANSLARYQAPVSVMSPNKIKNRNLLDDQAEQTLKNLLTEAGASL
jgi:hypothetical protein